ncbi:hypothetical protein PAXRUDRAFT_161451 [Paxillus rubicundulus Ve08.2h10]|uniref:Unplaced genomic scaffold scaffold_1476, whole genome shotgun sequence n=1 Tax=Paxillus rubicundulus Ve08.2h10 TaxID=930991 RepID=A0A0D0D6S8_9AGAM|nr:hypothetical protein PAXRUDRAFT_161451 [Paxillus rubicundulus Ve08.2h10]
MFTILIEAPAPQMGMITLNNASNCNKMMEDLEVLLKEKGVNFDSDGNRIRYVWVLQSDIVSLARQLVTACWASGQRREELSSLIRDEQDKGDWKKEDLRDVTLLHDVVTRWSSIYLMIDRLLELYPASLRNLWKHELNDLQLKVLADIRHYLAFFRIVQEEVSAEKTPTLSIVLPLYEKLIQHLKDAKTLLPHLAHAIDKSVRKLDEYLAESRKTQVYALPIILNPTLKFTWIEDHWTEGETKAVQEWIRNSHVRESQPAAPIPPATAAAVNSPFPQLPTASHAAHAQNRRLSGLERLSRSLSSGSITSSTSPSPSPPTPQERAAIEQRWAEQDVLAVDLELKKYRAAGVVNRDEALTDFDILVYWQAHKHTFPLLYRIALDMLPIQASTVPCERVFSSGKDTDTARQNSLSPNTMEILQILKFAFRGERLSFENGWCDSEQGLLITEQEEQSHT